MLAHSFLIKSSSKWLVTRTGIKARTSLISGPWFPWPIHMFFEKKFDLGTLDSGERSLPFGLLFHWCMSHVIRKPVLCHMQTTKVQINLHIPAVLRVPWLIHCLHMLIVYCLYLLNPNFQDYLVSIAQWAGLILSGRKPRRQVLSWHGSTWQNHWSECVPSEDSDQPGQPPSLIRVFTVHMKKPWALATHWVHSEDSNQTGWMPRLIWDFAGHTDILLVLSSSGSYRSFACRNLGSSTDSLSQTWTYSTQRPNEPEHDKTNKMNCAPCKDSDQPCHPPGLISIGCHLEEGLGP